MKESVKNVPHDMGDVSFYDAFGERVFASSGDAAHVRDYRRCEEVIDGYRCWGIYVEGVGCTNPDCPSDVRAEARRAAVAGSSRRR